MSLEQIIQLYAPLAGLIGLAFWTGMLTQRVADLKEDVKELQREASGESGSGGRLIKLEVEMSGVKTTLESIDRHMQGVQRQLATLATKGGFVPMMGEPQ